MLPISITLLPNHTRAKRFVSQGPSPNIVCGEPIQLQQLVVVLSSSDKGVINICRPVESPYYVDPTYQLAQFILVQFGEQKCLQRCKVNRLRFDSTRVSDWPIRPGLRMQRQTGACQVDAPSFHSITLEKTTIPCDSQQCLMHL
ncbi:MAG: hypothetical protein A2Z90_14505 [Burkholderiales bacterium GWA2_64_37]|nr:MAG: hypothetical protein A2Z90_14505 [Burkholderiales bacterium GWA2_64_37]